MVVYGGWWPSSVRKRRVVRRKKRPVKRKMPIEEVRTCENSKTGRRRSDEEARLAEWSPMNRQNLNDEKEIQPG